VDEMSKQVEDTTAELAGISDATRRQEVETRLAQYRQLYASLVSSYEQVRMAEAQTNTNVVVSDPALTAVQTGPKTSRNTLSSAIAAMLLAAAGIFGIDALDNTLKNPEEVRAKFGLGVLGVIAAHTSPEGRPVALDQPRSPVAEAFRALRTNVLYSSVDVRLRRVLITSPTPQDGKTTISSNLAVAFAQDEKRVVLIDADLRRPQQHKRFGLPNKAGLSEIALRGLDGLGQTVQETGVAGLRVLTSGALPPNPAELLGSRKMGEIIDCLLEESDLVLIDTPPVLSVTDAAALAPNVDGVILVVKPGKTQLAALGQTIEALRGVGARILGVVLNDVEPKNRRYGYYYHRYYSKYSYYYSAEGEKKKKRAAKSG
jgi:succinoglycan biosynthesis transport protein ExoP